MNRKASLVCLAGCFVAGSVLYVRDRPHVTPATVEELLAASPPELRQTVPLDPKAVDRYGRLVSVALGFDKAQRRAQASHGQKYNLDPSAYEAKADQIEDEGPLLRPLERGDVYDGELRPLASLANAIADEAKARLKAGDSSGCTKRLMDLQRLAANVMEARGTHLIYLVMSSLENTAAGATLQCVRKPQITSSDLALLLGLLRPGTASDRILADDWTIDYQQNVLPLLSNFNQVRERLSMLHREDFDPKQPVVGSYDAIATAQLTSELYLVGRRNALADWKHQDASDETIIRHELRRVPLGGAKPEGNWANRTLFEVQMNTTSNSIGSELVGEAGLGETEIKRVSVTSATRQELTRAVTALCLYKLRHGGRPAPDLSSLVSDHILPAVPTNFFQSEPLRYDPKRQLVYAVGPSGVDEASVLRSDGWTPSRTLGFFVSRPNT